MEYDAWGNVTGAEDGNWTGFSLDSWGRIVAVHTPEGGVERYTYDHAGNITSTIDANGGTITYDYNSMGKVYRVTDQEGCSEYFYYNAEGRLETRTDRSGNLSCLTDSTGRSIHYTYDTMDRLQQVADGQGETLASYSYNRAGGLRKLRYGNGIQTEYEYGDDGNLSSLVTVTGQGRVILNLGYAYDGNGNCTRKAGGQFRNEYAYDRMNRLVQTIQDGKTERYTYDLGNRLMKESGRETEVYQYNAKNQLTSLRAGDTTTRYRYDPQGNLLEERGDTWNKRYTYDAANRQTGIELIGPSSLVSVVLLMKMFLS